MFRLIRRFLLASVLLTASSLFAQDAMLTTPYYPLKIGNTWTYKTKEGNKFVMKVLRDDKVGADPCARVGLLVDGKEVGHEFISVTGDGVFRNGFGSATPDQPVRILKLPLKTGESWKIEGKALGDTFSGEFKVGKEEDVEVPAGKYKAFPVTSENLNASGLRASTTSYYAEKVGLIKQEIQINTQKTVIELEKFEEGPAAPPKP